LTLLSILSLLLTLVQFPADEHVIITLGNNFELNSAELGFSLDLD